MGDKDIIEERGLAWRQYKALMRKNLLLRRRAWVESLVEILFPIFLMLTLGMTYQDITYINLTLLSPLCIL